MMDRDRATHPGEVLLEVFMQPNGMDNAALAARLFVPEQAVSDIVDYVKPVSANMAIRLSRLFGTNEQYWMNMQLQWEYQTDWPSLDKVRPFLRVVD